MNLAMWTAIREYIAAEIKLSHLRPRREEISKDKFLSYRREALAANAEAIAEQEAQSTRMEMEVRRLMEGK